MSISYKQDSKKLYKLTFMCFFVFMFPREKQHFRKHFRLEARKPRFRSMAAAMAAEDHAGATRCKHRKKGSAENTEKREVRTRGVRPSTGGFW